MDADTFANRFAQAHQDVYLHAVRRVRDKREQLTREMYALDRDHVRRAAAQLSPARRALLAEVFGDLIQAPKTERPGL